MPKAKRLNVELADHLISEAATFPVYQDYSVEERAALREFLNGPIWRKAISNARCERPPLMVKGLDTALGIQLGNNRLHELRGWAFCEAALVKQILPPPEKRKQITETFPDAGRIDFQKP
jgi:hypothetical protein